MRSDLFLPAAAPAPPVPCDWLAGRPSSARSIVGGSFAYYFNPPSWALKAASNGDARGPCPVGPEALGQEYETALHIADTRLKLFDSWRTGGLSDLAPERATTGSFDWLAAKFQSSDKHRKMGRAVRKLREAGLSLVANKGREAPRHDGVGAHRYRDR
jgi:hypothetical protein